MNCDNGSDQLFSIEGCVPAVFVSRPNRFLLVATFSWGGSVEVHVPDPGRLKELLYPGNDLLIIPARPGSVRKTKWSLAGAKDPTGWILVNTAFHRKISSSLFSSRHSPLGIAVTLQAEVGSPSGKSRFDFLLNGDTWVEVKGCTLKIGRKALFPDAPTVRGVKHLTELTEMALRGLRTAVVFLVFVRDVECFSPNRITDPKFAEALGRAVAAGVEVYPVQLSFDGAMVRYSGLLNLVQDP
ncbi:MAG: DNA/RNA nuclease SfsA [Candidatus Sabulitectum sp.]|nr:DNA/RNA nuclease SfsA [Candidatus Sabulitectum sp.]